MSTSQRIRELRMQQESIARQASGLGDSSDDEESSGEYGLSASVGTDDGNDQNENTGGFDQFDGTSAHTNHYDSPSHQYENNQVEEDHGSSNGVPPLRAGMYDLCSEFRLKQRTTHRDGATAFCASVLLLWPCSSFSL